MTEGTAERPLGQRHALWSLAVFAAVIPLARPTLFKVGASGAQLADVVLPLVWLVSAASFVRRRELPRFDALFWLPAVYAFTQLVSLVIAHKLGAVPLVKLAAYCEMLLLPWLMSQFVTRDADVRFLLGAVTIGSAVAVAIGLLGFLMFYMDRNGLGTGLMCGWGGIKAGNYPRLCAPFNNPNLFLNYLAATSPLVIAYFADGLAPIFGPRALPRWAFIVAMGFISLFTLSAGVGGFAIAGAWGLAAWRRLRGLARSWFDWALALLAASLAAFFLATMTVTLSPPGTGDLSVGSHDVKLMDGMRPSIWKGLRIHEHPLTGVGYGEPVAITSDPRSFTSPDRLKDVVYPVAPHLMDGHNAWLNIIGQSGILGVVAFLALLLGLTRGVVWKRPSDTPLRLFWLRAITGSLVGAFAYHALVGSFEEARHLWLVLGLGVAVARLDRVAPKLAT